MQTVSKSRKPLLYGAVGGGLVLLALLLRQFDVMGVEALSLGLLGGLTLLLWLESRDRAKAHRQVMQTMEHFLKAHEILMQQMKGRPAEASQDQSALVAELRVLQTLVEQLSTVMAEREAGLMGHVLGPVAHDDGSVPLDRAALLHILKEALRHDRIEMLMQPIVSLPQRKPRFFECFSRLRDDHGTIVIPEHYIGIAEEESLIQILDNTLLFRCIQLARKALKKKISVPLFCNMSVATLKDHQFLESFMEFIQENQDLAPLLVFELNAPSLTPHLSELLPVLKKMGQRGCRFSLEHVESLDWDWGMLSRHHIQFIKIEWPVMKRLLDGSDPSHSFGVFQRSLNTYKMDLIVTKVEEEEDLRQVLDARMDFGQGYLFGAPMVKV